MHGTKSYHRHMVLSSSIPLFGCEMCLCVCDASSFVVWDPSPPHALTVRTRCSVRTVCVCVSLRRSNIARRARALLPNRFPRFVSDNSSGLVSACQCKRTTFGVESGELRRPNGFFSYAPAA